LLPGFVVPHPVAQPVLHELHVLHVAWQQLLRVRQHRRPAKALSEQKLNATTARPANRIDFDMMFSFQ
jgi:hypothetical protein